MEKIYVKPTSKVVELDLEVLLAGSNKLGNGEDGDDCAKELHDEDWD